MKKIRIVSAMTAAVVLATGVAAGNAFADSSGAERRQAPSSSVPAGQAFGSLTSEKPAAAKSEPGTKAFPLAVTLVASRVAVGITGRAGVKAGAKQFAKNVGQTGAGSAIFGG